MKKKFKIISEDLQKNLIDFLDEIQFDAAGAGDTDSMHKVNFCNWAINELLNSFDGYVKDEPKKKSRQDYVDETFLDWNLPDMTDEDFEKLVDTFDNFLKGWEKEYLKNNPNKKKSQKNKKNTEFKPHLDDIAEFMSLDEIKDFLLDDPELTDNERFELYYEERERYLARQELKKEKGLSYEELLKGANLKPPPKKK